MGGLVLHSPPGFALFSPRVFLLPAIVLLTACATVPPQSGSSGSRDLRLDTYSTHCGKYPATCPELAEKQAAASKALTVATGATRAIPVAAAALVLRDTEPQDELERQLVECAVQADLEVNRRWFGGRRPHDDECFEEVEVEVDGCLESMTRAAALGHEKHAVALACARRVLNKEWGDLYSIEPRYRFFRQTRLLESVSRDEETRLLASGCTKGLWRTIKPDIVLHGRENPPLACRVFDFKFPCLEGKKPQWTRYGPKSAFAGTDQGTIYMEALECRPVILSPAGVFR
ncbi:hypothetical protein JY651_29700 [Pyxidicoccus parkwayensis]|uniref:Lipoprotein n=1 Tax=Pyxidicoccus parkwayensis TaxID=2813578 RepID=A0ABX7NKV2_9BACT|nr:hypothetical protein [Pyxidicoccus parkwaysis]QSQ19481.1 hypothetical protein JY651_29700 [Pyxidicoccus parkwaysis]